jgi:uncharacterized protein YcnI
MPNSKMTVSLAALGLFASAASAFAHVTIQPKEATAGDYAQMTFSVPHGCEGSATVALRIKVPDGVMSAKPQMKPGWTVEIKTRKLDAPQPAGHGRSVSDVVDEVIWRGGPLPDNLYDTFGLVVKLPDAAGNLYFPAVQECEKGVTRWIEIPAASQTSDTLHEPAPAVRLKPKAQ